MDVIYDVFGFASDCKVPISNAGTQQQTVVLAVSIEETKKLEGNLFVIFTSFFI